MPRSRRRRGVRARAPAWCSHEAPTWRSGQVKEPPVRRVAKLSAACIATAALALTATACGSTSSEKDNSSSSASAGGGKGIKIGLAYDVGGRGDRSFNDSAARGADKAAKEFNGSIK